MYQFDSWFVDNKKELEENDHFLLSHFAGHVYRNGLRSESKFVARSEHDILIVE
jgi:hypothetical protein